VYSVQPTVLQDLNTLTDVCRETATAHAQDDPLECGGQWGMIQNRNVKVSFIYIVHPLRLTRLSIKAARWSTSPSTGPETQGRINSPNQAASAKGGGTNKDRKQGRRDASADF